MRSKNFNKPPHVSKALIDYLDDLIHPMDWKPEDHKDTIMFYSGKRELVNLLKHLHEEQKK